MKSLKHFTSFGAAILMLWATAAFARSNNSGSFDLAESAHIGSTLLTPGHYKAEWTGPNDALQISVLKNGQTVATAQGTMKQLPEKATNSEVTVKTGPDNRKQVEEIQFDNHAEALMLSGM
jgi:hypothetical protein